ncbi:alpha amylase C-terminal domain-containing protein [Candidatus Poribacteria bacterium]|nr:alpha amylase C-terminal domain-containing protein [Candidatus Poribacteria bacterium]
MGAIPHSGGTAFRVWAPNATAASVVGTFNSWSTSANPMTSEAGGNWYADVAGAVIGDQYKYVLTYGGVQTWKNDARALDVTNSVGNSVIADLYRNWQSSFTAPGFNETIVYEMHVGTLHDTPGGTPGTWQSAIQKLDHIASLNVNMIEVMPVGEFAGDFSWGYNPAHSFAPDSAYGTPLDFKAFVDAAHARGMGVILDVVYNHLGPSDLDLWCYDGPCFANGGIYFYADWRKDTPWGATRPDYGRSEVRSFLRDNAMYWLNEYRIDGLRWDSTVNIRTQNNGGGGDIGDGWSLMQWINNEINSSQPWKISIAEDLQNNDWITKTTGAGGAGFDSQWDAQFVHPIRDAVITGSDSNRDMWSVKSALEHKYNGQASQRVVYTESHDEVANGKSRVPEQIWPGNAASWYSKKRSTLGAALVYTAPGIPMIFQGQEFLEDGWFADTDPLDWNKAITFTGITNLYRDLGRLRRNMNSNTAGLRGDNINVFHVNNSAKVVAFHRWQNGGAGDDVIVVANFSGGGFTSYNIGFPSGGTWYTRFNSDWNGYDSSFGNWNAYNPTANAGAKDGLGYNGNVGIGPYSVIVLSK